MVDCIIEYKNKGCTPNKNYAERIEETFPFLDTGNCKRVYDEIMQEDETAISFTCGRVLFMILLTFSLVPGISH